LNNNELIKVKQLNKNLFKIYVMFFRQPLAPLISKELEYYSNEDNTIIATILLDLIDKDFTCVILCQDEFNVFRCIDVKSCFPTLEIAREWLFIKIRWWTLKGTKSVPQGGSPEGLDLFSVVISEEKIHPHFDKLNNFPSFIAAKKIISEVCRFFNDIDGNFIEQFQSMNGFDSRLWEIYLYCYFAEEYFLFNRNYDRPDFMVQKGDIEIAVEAVTIGRRKNNPPKLKKSLPIKTKEAIREENSNNMPLKFGSALFDKLKKRYWKLPHVQGKALIIAIADFHDEMSMTWSFNAITDYLYGYRYRTHFDKNGKLIITPEKIPPYTKENGTEIQAGFFDLPDTENISAVLFSSTGTLSKFTRIGIQTGFGIQGQKVVRSGACFQNDPNSVKPNTFSYIVTEDCSETWAEGLNLFHNPKAKIPIDKSLFPNIAHHELIDNFVHSITPDFHPFFSINHNLITTSSIKEEFE
jgi:hypothetical protein